jgi:thiamine biosynthesis lipoprotein
MKQLVKSSNKPRLDKSFAFSAIGTSWQIDFYEEIDEKKLAQIELDVLARAEDFDSTYSRFRSDSLVYKISKAAGKYTLPADSDNLMTFYEKLYDVTKSKVSPLIGQALSDSGYDANYSLEPKSITDTPTWKEVMNYSQSVLTTTRPVLLDFGAAGKGYLVDLLSEVIEAYDIHQYCIDASGDMIYKNDDGPIQVGLESPDDSSLAIGQVELQNQSICGSATNRRKWANYNHVLDPQTKKSVESVRAVWVVADTAMVADGLATALFFSGPAQIAKEFDFSYVRLLSDGQAEVSNNFNGQLFGDA